MSDRDEFGAFLLGFIVGGLTGAIASLLLTPNSGDETRTFLKEKAIELGDKVNVSVDDARVKADEITAEARSRAESILAEARTRAEDLQRRGQVVLEEQKERVTKAVKSTKEDISKAAEE